MPVYLVGAGPGDPGLLTRRGAELLATADVVVYDRLIDRSLLDLAPPGAELVDAGKWPAPPDGAAAPIGPGATRQGDINAVLVDRGRAGLTVVRLKGGDPFLFGRGGEEAAALEAAGVPWAVVPGVSSATAAPAAVGIPVTHRGLSASVTVVTGHVGEDTSGGEVDWEALARTGGTLVVLMGMATRAEIARRLVAAGMDPRTPVALVEWATTPDQRSLRTTLGALDRAELGSPVVIVVGTVAGLGLDPARGWPLAGWRVVVTRAEHQAGALSAALRAAGADVVELPTIAIGDPADGGAALAEAAARLSSYDWVVFTSANAVHRLFAQVRDARAVGTARLAAVGRATAAALEAHGLVADLVPGQERAEGLVAEFPPAPPGGSVLFARSAVAAGTLAEGLGAKGWAVDEVEAYRPVPAPAPSAGVAAALAGADAVTFTSPSSVSSYLRLVDQEGRALRVPPVVACIGPVTGAAARKEGLEVSVEAATPSGEGLVAALVAYRVGAGQGGPAGP